MHSLAGDMEYAVVDASGDDVDSFPTVRAARRCRDTHERCRGGCKVIPRIT